MVDFTTLKSPLDWPAARGEVEKAVLSVLGAMPKDRMDLQMKTLDETDGPGYTRKRVNYFVDSWTRVTAWVFEPEQRDEAPALLCCHQEVPQGKDEPAGLEGKPQLAFARRYAEMGYVTIAPDCVTAGERVLSRSEPYEAKAFYKDYPKMSLLGKMLVDHRHAIDALCEMGRVDSARIGVIGHGLGATNALLLAAFDDRVQTCVASCGFSRFENDKKVSRWWTRENGMDLLPGLQAPSEAQNLPFDWEDVLALCAPSPVLVVNSASDSQFSNPKSCQKAVTLAGKVYRLIGAKSALDYYGHYDGHHVTPETLEVADDWFDRWL